MSPSPVLVVGAGPTGLATALSLAQFGVAVRIIDRLDRPASQSRAAIMHARTVEMFDRLGIAGEFLEHGVKLRGASIYGPGNTPLARPALDRLPTPYPFMLGIDQCMTERLLAGRLEALGVRVERRVEMLGFTQSPTAVAVRLQPASGAPVIEEFSFLVGADGVESAVRSGLGLPLEGETLDATWITADVKIRWDREPDEAFAFFAHDGLAFIAPMNGGRWRVIANLHNLTKEEAAALALADVEKIVREQFEQDAALFDPAWIGPFSINTRMVSTMRAGRVFLAGDAAHVHSPVGSQGMNTGIQDGLNLAWKLALVLKGVAAPELLESYNAERHENAKRLLRTAGPAAKMLNFQQPVAAEIRNLVIRVADRLGLGGMLARDFSMIEVTCSDSPIVEEHHGGWTEHGPLAGHRAPDADGLVANGGEPRRLFSLWKNDPRHQLLLFSGGQAGSAEFQAATVKFAGLGGFLRVLPIGGEIADSKGEAHERYGVGSAAAILVRPDGYIAARAPLSETAFVSEYIERWYPGAYRA